MLKQDIWVCNHCGYDVLMVPPQEAGCNHVHYPEFCPTCANKAKVQRVVTDYEWSRVVTLHTVDWHDLPGA